MAVADLSSRPVRPFQRPGRRIFIGNRPRASRGSPLLVRSTQSAPQGRAADNPCRPDPIRPALRVSIKAAAPRARPRMAAHLWPKPRACNCMRPPQNPDRAGQSEGSERLAGRGSGIRRTRERLNHNGTAVAGEREPRSSCGPCISEKHDRRAPGGDLSLCRAWSGEPLDSRTLFHYGLGRASKISRLK